jgi:4-amino-4-deoxy-L-arabinose transferase-like glycosyltransferase
MSAPGPSPDPTDARSTAAPRRFWVGGPFLRSEWAVLAGVAAAYLLVVVLAVRRGPPLGWDEAVYALRGRDFAAGVDPLHYWQAYRAPGLSWLGHLVWIEGHEVPALRFLVAAFGCGLVATTWLLARHLFGRRAGLIAAAGTALTPPLLLAATQVWPDVPGACLGLLAVALFVFATGGDRPSWWILLLPAAVAAATLMRFGAPLPMVVGLAGVAFWRRRVLARGPAPVVAAAVASTAVVVLVLAVPGIMGSATPLAAIGGLADRPFQGFVDYSARAGEVAGSAAVVVALCGLVAALAWSGRRAIDRGVVLMAATIGLATAVAIATVLHGEVRYLAPAYPWLWLAAAPGLAATAAAFPGRWDRVVAAVLALALVVAAAGAVQDRNNEAKGGLATVVAAAEVMAGQAGGGRCVVVASRVPQMAWYSGCEARSFDLERVRLPAPSRRAAFMVLVEGDPHQPEGALLEAYLAAAGEPLAVVEGLRTVTVYRVGERAGGG